MMIFLVFLELYAGYLSAITLGGYSVQNLSSLKSTVEYDGARGLYYAKSKVVFC
jgi:hypothetical protein